ncbi:MAG: efflux RND transporter periplasmic adaptor subunit [Planctomycetes bacterium]|nr:efflux RND transporter periplasmic adaptor subunit [Planctomycetota bacterium]
MRTRNLPALALLLGLAACSKPGPANPAPAGRAPAAVPVLLRAVKTEPVEVEVAVNGTLHGEEELELSAKLSGRILSIEHDLGDRCAAGALLARVDPVDYQLALDEKELAVREALAKIGLTELPKADFDPASVPVVQRARLQADNAQSRFERTQQLYEKQPPRVTLQERDDARTEASVARSNLDVELLGARAQLDVARTRAAELASATQRLEDTQIRAPASPQRPWAVSARLVSAGEYVREGTPLFRLVDDSRIKLRAQAPERCANGIAQGQEVLVTVASSSEAFHGRVARINPQIDPQSRSFEVEIGLENERGLLHPGAFARARIRTRVDPKVVFVPQEALISFAGVDKVFVVEDGKARAIEIVPGERSGDWIAVRQGLVGDESVVVSGTSKLATGVAVDARPAEAGQ